MIPWPEKTGKTVESPRRKPSGRALWDELHTCSMVDFCSNDQFTSTDKRPLERITGVSGWLNLLPNMAFIEHTCDIASPVAARPAQTLLQKFRIIFQSGLYLGLFVILVPDLLIMRNKPSGNEIVVVRVELIATKPFLVGKSVDECFISDDVGSICHGSAGETGQATIHVHASGTIKVSPLEIECTKEAPDPLLKSGWFSSSEPLVRTDSSILFTLQGG